MRSLLKILIITLAMSPLMAWSASKVELDARVRAAVNSMYSKVPASRELVERAAGILVFPNILKGGFFVGGEIGEGALIIGDNLVQYYRLTALSVGLQFGGQSKTEVVVFMTSSSLKEFRESEGWEAGVDGSIALVEFGVGKEFDTHNVRNPIIGFVFDNKGLMVDVSLEGSKFTKIEKN